MAIDIDMDIDTDIGMNIDIGTDIDTMFLFHLLIPKSASIK